MNYKEQAYKERETEIDQMTIEEMQEDHFWLNDDIQNNSFNIIHHLQETEKKNLKNAQKISKIKDPEEYRKELKKEILKLYEFTQNNYELDEDLKGRYWK